jgi:hypothetical protein
VSDDGFLRVEANDCPMSSCAAPAGSPCQTGRGKVAAQYHTARFRLVPHLAEALSVPVPPLPRPGSAWAELPPPGRGRRDPGRAHADGYARASTIRQSLDTQMEGRLRAGIRFVHQDDLVQRVTMLVMRARGHGRRRTR